MQTDPNKKVQKPLTVQEFNKQIKDWTYQVRYRAASRLAAGTKGASGNGNRLFNPSFKYNYGEIFSTGFKFAYYLVFVHYGVGRGYIHKNNTVVRGRKANDKHKFYRGKPAKKWKNYNQDNRPILRNAYDWLDVEIKKSFDRLADAAANYHGDRAAQEVMQNSNKLLINKRKNG